MWLKTDVRNEFYDNFYIRKHRFRYFEKIKVFRLFEGGGAALKNNFVRQFNNLIRVYLKTACLDILQF